MAKCCICLLDLLSPIAACSAQTSEYCQAKQSAIQSHEWPFRSTVNDPSTCMLCENEKGTHKRGIQGGWFCKQKTRHFCCNCGKTMGIGRCIERSCPQCLERQPALQKVAVKEQLSASPAPYHLVVLLHGIDGYPTELMCLQDKLEAFRDQHGNRRFLTFAPDCYVGKTHSGIETCGNLVHGAVRNFVELCNRISPKTVSHISFVGHSLGGLIGRSAVTRLADPGDGNQDRIAGLKAAGFVSTSSPHLGLDRAFGLPKLPSAITLPISGLVAGQSGRDVFGSGEEGGVVQRLAGAESVAAAGRFEGRRLYALERGDHVIAPERALFLPAPSLRTRASPPTEPLPGLLQLWCLPPSPAPAAELTVPWAGALEALGWSKVLLRMPRIPWWCPNGHIKVTANHKEGMYGDEEGNWVMQDVVEYLAGLGL